MSNREIHVSSEWKSKIHHSANLHFEYRSLATPLQKGQSKATEKVQ